MKTVLLLIFFSAGLFASAQRTINVDDSSKFTNSILYFNSGSGIPYVLSKYAKIVEGSVFIPESLSPAQIYIKGIDKALNNVLARLNIVDNQLNYFDEVKGIELTAVDPISEVRFKDSVSGEIRIFTRSIANCAHTRPGWYEMLESGKLSLYRQVIKKITETKPYGSATSEQRVETFFSYWIQAGEDCRAVKKISELANYIVEVDPELKSKLPQRKLYDKKEEDWIELAKLYNSSHQ